MVTSKFLELLMNTTIPKYKYLSKTTWKEKAISKACCEFFEETIKREKLVHQKREQKEIVEVFIFWKLIFFFFLERPEYSCY